MKLIISLLSICFLLSCGKFNPSVNIKDIRKNVSYLASDSLKGRKSGTIYDQLAAGYILQKFINAGLTPMYDNGIQKFTLITSAELGPGNSMMIDDKVIEPNKDFLPYSFSANTEVTGEVVFCGYGFNFRNDSVQWNDYSGLDVKGKWVILLKGDPDFNKTISAFAGYSDERVKVLTASDLQVAGVIFTGGPEYSEKDELSPLFFDKNSSRYPIPVIQVTRSVADLMLSKSGKTIADAEKEINTNLKSTGFGIPAKVTAKVNVVFNEVESGNVVAYIPGTDSILKDEYIVVGAHYDHLGTGGPGSGSRVPDTTAIHNGADDNASGVASVIELAEKFASGKQNRRSIIFAAFGAEEMGIIGSKAFTKNPPVSLNKTVAMFNFDMVGRLDSASTLSIGGSGTSAEAETMLRELNTGFNLAFSPEGYGPSDHASFYIENIPVFFISTGSHGDYHTPADDADSINYEGMKKIIDYIYLSVNEVSNRNERLSFREAGPKVQRGRAARFKVTLGIMPDYAGLENRGLRIDAVTKGKPAELGGMKKGDIIIAIEGKKTGNIYDYMNRLKELKAGQRISVDILRDNREMVLIVQL